MSKMTLEQVLGFLRSKANCAADSVTAGVYNQMADAIDAELKRQASVRGEAVACHRLLWKDSRGDWQAHGSWADGAPSKKLVDDIAAQSTEPLRWKLEVAYAHPAGPAGVPDVKAMVDRFLSWRLPATFAPDGWVRFVPPAGASDADPSWPVGTNLFSAEQAEAMVRHMLAAAPSEDKP